MRNTKIAAAAHRAGLAGLLATAAAATVVGFAGSAQAAPAAGPNGNHGKMYGDPVAAAPYWRPQHLVDDCAELAIADVVGQITHHEPTEQEILEVAKSTPSKRHPGQMVYQAGVGTDAQDSVLLLAHYGIQSEDGLAADPALDKSAAPAALDKLETLLAQGRKVIPTLNGQTIWNVPGDHTTPDHAVVITGVDTKAGVVHLNDSGDLKTGRDEQVPIATFEAAWATSKFFVVMTK